MIRRALIWALWHAPVILFLYFGSLLIALRPLPGGYRAAMIVAWSLEAFWLTILAFLVGLVFCRWPRVYRWAAPAILGLFLLCLLLDSRLYEALAFHLNGLIIRVAFQHDALSNIGIPASQFALFAAIALVLLATDVMIGASFIGGAGAGAKPWRWRYVLLLLLVPLTEMLYRGVLQFAAGRVVFAAADVLPLQIPFRMHQFLEKLTGRSQLQGEEQVALSAVSHERSAVFSPDSIHVTRRPDIVLVLLESLRADFFNDSVMPRLWQRSATGARMMHHIASASSTHYALFSIAFGRNASRLEQVVGSGQSPLLFGALRRHGYAMRIITASSVDWMGLKQTVFKDVAGDLETDIPGTALQADSTMFAHARTWTAAQPDTQPVFVLLFLGATHFNYNYTDRSRRFTPDWDGKGSITAARVDPILMKRRAMNSALEADWSLDDFLTWFSHDRGRRPLTVITGDHGEAFREHGRVGHGAGVAEEEIHVPMVVLDDSVPPATITGVTSHVDIVPTIFHLLGDTHDPAAYSDGAVMTHPPQGRFVVSTAGWIPRFAVVGDSLKAQFFSLDAGLGTVTLTGPADQPLPNAGALLRSEGPRILRALRR